MSLLDRGTGLLRLLPPELSHRAALLGLDAAHAAGLLPLLGAGAAATGDSPAAPVRAMGLEFPNAVGVAAGLDKEARHLPALAALGPGFVELGTVTPRPCAGNAGGRLWRLPRHRALVNRLGFPNPGMDAFHRRLHGGRPQGLVVGISVGKHPQTPAQDALGDIEACLERLWDCGDYFAVNISSPNSPGLRALEVPEALGGLVQGLRECRERLAQRSGTARPLAVKLSADIEDGWVPSLAQTLAEAGMDAAILCNTTLQRPGGAGEHLREGGLSGAPLAERSRQLLRMFRDQWGGGKGAPALVSCGGIMDGEEAAERIRLGADLVQLYTGIVYAGPGLIGAARDALAKAAGATPAESGSAARRRSAP